MKGKGWLVLVSTWLMLMLIALPLMTACAKPAPEEVEVIELSYATMRPATHSYTQVDMRWAERIEKETNGRVHITIYPGGVLIDPLHEWAEVRKGTADIAYVISVYDPAGFHIQKAVAGFFTGVTDYEVGRRITGEIWEKFPSIREEYGGVKVLALSGLAPYWLVTKKPVRTLEDLRGKTFKSLFPWNSALEAAGATGISLPMSEAYISVDKGIIDGVLTPVETLKSFRLAEVAPYCTRLDLFWPDYSARVMNLDTWNSLPADIQKVFEQSSAWWESETDKAVMKSEQEGFEFAKEMGVEFITLPEEDLRKFHSFIEAEALANAAELDAKGYPGTQIYKEVRQLIEKYSK